MKNSRSDRIKKLMLDLVRIQSDTGTRQEQDVETYLHEWLGRREYFKNHPEFWVSTAWKKTHWNVRLSGVWSKGRAIKP